MGFSPPSNAWTNGINELVDRRLESRGIVPSHRHAVLDELDVETRQSPRFDTSSGRANQSESPSRSVLVSFTK